MPAPRIDFFDDSSDVDMKRAEQIIATKKLLREPETVMFPYTKLVWED
jgi:hypothetical protein